MSTILTFTFATPSATYDVVELADDGTVTRATGRPTGPSADVRLGWWQGALDPAVAGTATRLAAAAWPDAALPRPPAAGAWTASGATSRRGLWGDPDEVGSALRVLLAECTESATTPLAVVRLTATQAADDAPVLLSIASSGSVALEATLRDDALTSEETVVFITEEAEVVGYLGTPLPLPPGTRATGVLHGRRLGPDGQALTGSLRVDGRAPLSIAARVTSG
ncbi:hypothetical protein FHP29_12655 [Nocardioides albidus]|uniref:Uncharacterized protein n=1 Tax=Nocardioides albidus TaxID=1517589 RepID=A0A5C4VUY8_9ACTN|nr:hypothetical protein [Nocardioides albidus]TNM39710.1 hypothetical protein FHP29_12655 [Nocardioides albidus]